MKNTRFTIRMNASRHDVTDHKAGEVMDLSRMDSDKLTSVASALSVVKGLK